MFLIALITLALELLLTRIVSVMAFYHLSFFVISLAILGMTAGALLIYVYPAAFAPEIALPRYTRLFAISLPLTLGAVLVIPIPPSTSLSGVLGMTLVALVLSVPFALSGILVSLTLTRCGISYGTIYCADLVGAGIGAIVFLVGLDTVKPGTFVFLLAALAAAAGTAYRRFFQQSGSREFACWACLFLGLAVHDQMFGSGLVLLHAKGEFLNNDRRWFEGWNHHSRVAVTEPGRREPFLWGPSPKTPALEVEEAYLTIDAGAGTHLHRFNGDPETVRWLFHDVTALAYQIQQPRRVAIIGIGGGRDALCALVARADHVVGIDVNSLIIHLLDGQAAPDIGDFVGVGKQPTVSLVHDDARSYLATTSERFDVVQMSLIDTWAANAAGAYTMTENGLYTEEAWATFFDALSDRGLWTVSRWYHPDGLDDCSRMLSMAIALCLDRGLVPERHVLLASAKDMATLIVSKSPLGEDVLANFDRVCQERAFRVLIRPGRPCELPLYQSLRSCQSHQELQAVCDKHLLNIAPPTDDCPYFFNQLRLRTAWEFYYGQWRTVAVNMGNLSATLTLLVALGIASAGLLVGIVWPLRQVPFPADVPAAPVRLCWVYFIAIGVGYMLIEMALVQRFSVLLGHPSHALAVVLSSMILATGVGSLLADRLPTDRPAIFLVFPWVVVLVQLAAWLLLPGVFANTVQSALPVRVMATLAFTIPCGIVMGFCFPLGMVQSSRLSDSLAPWMWGINGAAGVVGTILAVFLSMSLGISATFLVGIVCYVVVGLVNLKLRGLVEAKQTIDGPDAKDTVPALDAAN
jgi:hypothetical protein